MHVSLFDFTREIECDGSWDRSMVIQDELSDFKLMTMALK